MKRLIALIFILGAHTAYAQIDTLNQRIFLIGDAGQLNPAGQVPVIEWLRKNADFNDSRNVFIFLGDNIYPDGLPVQGDPEYQAAKAHRKDAGVAEIVLVEGV